jgi:Ca2+-binding EF-hand superfamily protein
MWLEIDDDRSRDLTFDEFQLGLINHNIQMNQEEIIQLFKIFDSNNTGRIDYNEFLIKLRVNIINKLIFISVFSIHENSKKIRF